MSRHHTIYSFVTNASHSTEDLSALFNRPGVAPRYLNSKPAGGWNLTETGYSLTYNSGSLGANGELFNNGDSCKDYAPFDCWRSIKVLLEDKSRPLWDVTSILKPFNCSLMDQLHRRKLKRRVRLRGRG